MLKLTVAAALALAFMGGMLASGDAPVEAKCWPYYFDARRVDEGHNYQDGRFRVPGGTVYGAQATIENYSPWVQPTHISAAWVGLERNASAHIAQTGWLEFDSDRRYTFVEWTNANLYHLRLLFDPYEIPYSTLFEVYYDPAGYFEFYIGRGSSHEGYARMPGYFVPNQADAMGEVTTLATQMPGANYNDDWLFAEAYQLQRGGIWYPLNGQRYVSLGGGLFFDQNFYGYGTIGIYDRTCDY